MIKYEEGFWKNEQTGAIVGRPSPFWKPINQDRADMLDYILACAMALLTSIFFLLQAFYHYISKSVTKTSFMSSFEFRLNIVFSVMVIVVFPLIQFIFRGNLAVREAAPQMAFSSALLIIAFLGMRTHFRFKSLLKVAMLTISESTQGVVEKLEYFKDMNMILSAAMLGSGLMLGIASADGLSPNPRFARNKFASDLLVTNLNFFEFIVWVTLVMIFYPRRSGSGSVFGSSNGGGSLSRTAPSNTRTQTYHQGNNNRDENYDNSKDRPTSLIPYKAPNASTGASSNGRAGVTDAMELERVGSYGSYKDTHPLTHHDASDLAQMNAFKNMYDNPQAYNQNNNSPSQSFSAMASSASGSTVYARQQPGNSIGFSSPPQSPNSLSSYNHFRAQSPIRSNPDSPSLVLDAPPRSTQYNYGKSEIGNMSPTSPTRPRKEPRVIPLSP
ncbi:hypothetical protein BGW38_006469 [Lunasporangiospora selenospora]|uniref:Uncharacterized protein n=1 Tax=Lunasporangiospora selenospora TaxID=979761 RepID=A0A9P6FM90_9FUNG|nr:hypothetical protein BGW38_006469 [Lunasporangiospora selenospora]